MTDPTEPAPQDGAEAGLPQGEAIHFSQQATWGGIVPIAALNAVLNIVTLSLWRFWGRTRVRRYLWSSTLINGSPLEYTGSGWELCRSFLFVMAVIFLPLYLAMFAGSLFLPPEFAMMILALAYIPLLLLFAWLFGMAVWVARRYRLSRTTWRGIRLGQAGSANGYAWAAIGYNILNSITLGWYTPASEMRLFRRLWNETFYGDRRFHISHDDEGLAGPLYPTFALAWFAGVLGYFGFIAGFIALVGVEGSTAPVPDLEYMVKFYGLFFVYMAVVGLFSLPYAAALLRRKAEIVGLDGLSFRLDARTFSLAWVYIGNFFIVALTLGFGLPIAQMRIWRYIFRRLEAEGVIDIEAIRQNADRGPKAGEGLADAFDIGNVI